MVRMPSESSDQVTLPTPPSFVLAPQVPLAVISAAKAVIVTGALKQMPTARIYAKNKHNVLFIKISPL